MKTNQTCKVRIRSLERVVIFETGDNPHKMVDLGEKDVLQARVLTLWGRTTGGQWAQTGRVELKAMHTGGGLQADPISGLFLVYVQICFGKDLDMLVFRDLSYYLL